MKNKNQKSQLGVADIEHRREVHWIKSFLARTFGLGLNRDIRNALTVAVTRSSHRLETKSFCCSSTKKSIKLFSLQLFFFSSSRKIVQLASTLAACLHSTAKTLKKSFCPAIADRQQFYLLKHELFAPAVRRERFILKSVFKKHERMKFMFYQASLE
jgi:hypothetical protein